MIVRLKSPEDAVLGLETKLGRVEIKLTDLSSGQAKVYLDGQVEARRVPTYAPLATGPVQEDFPAAVGDGKGGAWVAIATHDPRGDSARASLRERPKDFKSFVPQGGGDRIELIHYDPSSTANGQRIEVAGTGRDVWRPAVGRDERGKLVVVWAEQKDSNWDLYADVRPGSRVMDRREASHHGPGRRCGRRVDHGQGACPGRVAGLA